MKTSKKILFAFISIIITAGMSLLFHACSIHPLAWQPEPKPTFTGELALNEKLNTIQKIGLNSWYGPEDIVFDSVGNMYCGVHIGEKNFSDGRILKIDTSGKAEEFFNTNSWVAGLHFDNQGNLIALSHKLGLISISPEKK